MTTNDKLSRQLRYFESEKGREARKRAILAQAERRADKRKREAERKRVQRLVDEGTLEAMSASARRQYLERCRDVNPIMYELLIEQGVV